MSKLEIRPRQAPREFSARSALISVASLGAVGAGIAGAHLFLGIGLPCPFLALTGWQCPFCGSTRAAGALLRGDLAAAWAYNQLLIVAIVVLGACSLAWLVEVAGGPALRPPARWRPLTQQKVYAVLGVVALAFVLARNL